MLSAPSSVHLIGGGWDPDHAEAIYGPFLSEATTVAARSGGRDEPEIACLVLDEGDGAEQFDRWRSALESVAGCRPVPVLVDLGGRLDGRALGDADGLLVCGGLTPAYAAALAPTTPDVIDWLRSRGRPYAGFSAGAAIAAGDALVGGWLSGGVPICPDDAGEDLDEIAVRPGLGLVPFTVDVHCTQWGTLPRLIESVRSKPGALGVGIDENTVLSLTSDAALVRGRGQVWRVQHADGATRVKPYRDGAHVHLD